MPGPTNMSPNVDNYFVGKGIVTIQPWGTSGWIDIGNVPDFEFTAVITKLDHFSARAGIKVKDASIVVEKAATLKMIMEEWTAQNLSMALLGQSVSSGTIRTIDILSEGAYVASVKFDGTNDVGAHWNFEFPRVEFTPSKAITLIGDTWGSFEVTGDVVVVDNSFGTAWADLPDQ
jgi:hypothetical protein